jgi:hypothetical protein
MMSRQDTLNNLFLQSFTRFPEALPGILGKRGLKIQIPWCQAGALRHNNGPFNPVF